MSIYWPSSVPPCKYDKRNTTRRLEGTKYYYKECQSYLLLILITLRITNASGTLITPNINKSTRKPNAKPNFILLNYQLGLE